MIKPFALPKTAAINAEQLGSAVAGPTFEVLENRLHST
jgi:hypothetical protein